MPVTANKVKYGLKNVHYAVLSESAAGVISYATPVPMPGAISINMNPSVARKMLAADDSEYWTADITQNYSGDLNMALIPDSFRADCLGELTDADSGVKYETSQPVMSRFALLFEFDGDAHKRRHVLYNCSASKPAVASQTVSPDDGPEPSTESVTLTARPRKDTLVKAWATPDAAITTGTGGEAVTTNVYDSWFTSVFVPSEFAA